MKRQKIRRLLLIISLLLFPVTLYYFSPALIINGAFKNVMNGSFITFLLMLVLSIPFRRVFCGYLCPAGSLQDVCMSVNDKSPKQKWRNNIKYIIWAVWLTIVVICFISSGGIKKVDPLFETYHGISVSDIMSYVIYYGIICLIAIPTLIGGKRTFCHYFCWMAPFMIIGTKIARAIHLPNLQVSVKDKESCISCGLCSKNCPMSIDVVKEIDKGAIHSTECIQCGKCIDGCPKNVLKYGMKNGREK